VNPSVQPREERKKKPKRVKKQMTVLEEPTLPSGI